MWLFEINLLFSSIWSGCKVTLTNVFSFRQLYEGAGTWKSSSAPRRGQRWHWLWHHFAFYCVAQTGSSILLRHCLVNNWFCHLTDPTICCLCDAVVAQVWHEQLASDWDIFSMYHLGSDWCSKFWQSFATLVANCSKPESAWLVQPEVAGGLAMQFSLSFHCWLTAYLRVGHWARSSQWWFKQAECFHMLSWVPPALI